MPKTTSPLYMIKSNRNCNSKFQNSKTSNSQTHIHNAEKKSTVLFVSFNKKCDENMILIPIEGMWIPNRRGESCSWISFWNLKHNKNYGGRKGDLAFKNSFSLNQFLLPLDILGYPLDTKSLITWEPSFEEDNNYFSERENLYTLLPTKTQNSEIHHFSTFNDSYPPHHFPALLQKSTSLRSY